MRLINVNRFLVFLLLTSLAILMAISWWQYKANYIPPNSSLESDNIHNINKEKAEIFNKLQTKESYLDTIDKPIFYSHRSPIQSNAEHLSQKYDSTQNKNLSNYMLTGTIITPDTRLSILRDSESGSIYKGSVGDDLGGWILQSIDNNTVTISRKNKQHKLEVLIPENREDNQLPDK